MEDFAGLHFEELANMMMESLLGSIAHGLRGDNAIPEVYDASDLYDSSLFQEIFLEEFEKNEDCCKPRMIPALLPTILHGIVPSSLEDFTEVCVSDVLKKVNHIYDVGIRQLWEGFHTSGNTSSALAMIQCSSYNNGTTDGLWINESMLNNSCTLNCTWSNIGDQIFIRTTKPVQKAEELCIAYSTRIHHSYEKRAKAFNGWIRPGLGFECICDHCDLLRRRDDLRQLAKEFYDGMDELKANGTSLGSSGRDLNAIFPASRRQTILRGFSDFPLRLQHAAVAELHELEGSYMAGKGDFAGALKASLLSTNINYEMGASDNLHYFMVTWKAAGFAVACTKNDLALELFEKTLNSAAFQVYSL